MRQIDKISFSFVKEPSKYSVVFLLVLYEVTMSQMSDPIKEYFADQEVFITGATGLMGKVLVEKLLRSCPAIKRIYILIRTKKDVPCQERLAAFKKTRIFGRLREENPKVLDKLFAVAGDITHIGLGLSPEHLELLQNVTVIFHAAASIRFDDPLKEAVILNVRGTRETLRVAENLKNLKTFLHVSTTFSNPYESYIKEEVYPSYFDWRTAIKLVETLDEATLNALTLKFLGKFPNTYTLTKHLAESVANDYKSKFHVVIFRPSIVTNAFKEPYPGWFDTFLGPVGILIAAGTGVIRVLYCDPDLRLDVSPLDESIKTMIVTVWNESTLPPLQPDENVRVYNSSSTNIVSYTTSQLINSGLNIIENVAFNKTIWYPRLEFTTNKYNYLAQLYLFHVFPALIVDGLLKLFGRQPFLMQVHRKMYTSQAAVKFFMFRGYTFENVRLFELMEPMKAYDDFRYDTMIKEPIEKHSMLTLTGGRRYMLKEDDSTIIPAQKRLRILKYLDLIIRNLFFFWLGKTVFNILWNLYKNAFYQGISQLA